MKSNIYFKQIEIGPMANFVYLIGDPITHEAAIVDPAWDVPEIIRQAQNDGYQIKHILVTHGHPDHINGVEEMIQKTNARLWMHKDEVPWIGGWKDTATKTQNGDVVQVGNVDITCIHTPGHTKGSQCFCVRKNLISGDTLFIDGCGRTDLPGGNAEELYDSLKNRIGKLSDDFVLCPGHNYSEATTDTLGHQKQTNPYLQFETVSGFVGKRTGKK